MFLLEVILFLLSVYVNETHTTYQITMVSLSNFNAKSVSAVVAQEFAIDEINKKNLLPNITLSLTKFNANSDTHQVMIEALNIINFDNTNDNVYFPIILGAPWSSLSTLTAPVLGAANMGQISSSATSIALSKTALYPYFYRTIPSDDIQAQGLIALCKTMKWLSIAVIYISDPYGLYLSLGIKELSKTNNINVTSVGISYDDKSTYINAAEQIKSLKKYIIILIMFNNKISDLFTTFKDQGIATYPYFYLAVDGWLDERTIQMYNLANITAGYCGTAPWQPNSLDLHQYNDNIYDIIRHSKMLYEKLESKYYNETGEKTPSNAMIYGYDAMYTLVYAIQEIENHTSLHGSNVFDMILNGHNDKLIDILNYTIINQISFDGASGHVAYNGVGDRVNGLYSFGNILKNGSINYIGYFYENISNINVSKMIWPDAFNEKHISPRSHQHIKQQIISINIYVSISMFTFACLSISYGCFICISLIRYRENDIIVSASWKLRIIMCIGAILGYISVILFNIDERITLNYKTLNILCNLRICLLIVSYSGLFMPLIVKTYRLTKIFSAGLKRKKVTHNSICIILNSILIDFILAAIFVFAQPYQRITIDGEFNEYDELSATQFQYGRCSFYNTIPNMILIVIILTVKIIQAVFGVYVALVVPRIFIDAGILDQLIKFDEIGKQLSSILLTIIIISLTIPIYIFGPNEKPNFYCLLISIVILLIGNIVLSLNLLPRIVAIISKNESKFVKTVEQNVEDKVRKFLQNISRTKKSKSKSNTTSKSKSFTDSITKFNHKHLGSREYKNVTHLLNDHKEDEEKKLVVTDNKSDSKSDEELDGNSHMLEHIGHSECEMINRSNILDYHNINQTTIQNLNRSQLIELCLSYAMKLKNNSYAKDQMDST
eukprot:314389_1